jgi:aryl-alcohol dehydrogenase-like predicted oxidoreductase
MEYRHLGKWGPRVSVIGLGSYLTIGMKVGKKDSTKIVRKAIEYGVNYFDTANSYNRGLAEETLGDCLSEFPRESIFILTKVWASMGQGPNDRGLSAKHIREECDASLRRLKMDYLDLYMCHRQDLHTPLEETIRVMDSLIRAGKILYWGVSEWPAWLIMKAQYIAREIGAPPLVVNQPRYNLLYRNPEKEVFPITLEEGIGNVIFSPLAHGLLTSKYPPGKLPLQETRAADSEQNAIIMGMYWNEDNLNKAEELGRFARELGTSAARLAIAWCMKHPAVSSVILGVRSVNQLEENLKALEIRISAEMNTRLDQLFPPTYF